MSVRMLFLAEKVHFIYLQLLPELAAERNEYDPSKCDCDPKFIEMLKAKPEISSVGILLCGGNVDLAKPLPFCK